MVTGIKCFILLLIISLIPLEWIRFSEGSECHYVQQTLVRSEGNGLLHCLSEITCSFLEIYSFENEDVIKNCDDDKHDAYRKNEQYPIHCFIDTSVRTVDWISQFRWNLRKYLADLIQKNSFWDEAMLWQKYSNKIYIPELAYYIYMLREITI